MAERSNGLGLKDSDLKTLNQLDVISFHSNGDRSMEQFYGQHQAFIPALTHKNSLNPVKRASANDYAAPGRDKSMRDERNIPVDRRAKALDLFLRNRRPVLFSSDETQDAGRSQYF